MRRKWRCWIAKKRRLWKKSSSFRKNTIIIYRPRVWNRRRRSLCIKTKACTILIRTQETLIRKRTSSFWNQIQWWDWTESWAGTLTSQVAKSTSTKTLSFPRKSFIRRPISSWASILQGNSKDYSTRDTRTTLTSCLSRRTSLLPFARASKKNRKTTKWLSGRWTTSTPQTLNPRVYSSSSHLSNLSTQSASRMTRSSSAWRAKIIKCAMW